MQRKNLLKRGLAMILAVCVTVGIVPTAQGVVTVKAAESEAGIATNSSVFAFATKEQLLNDLSIAGEGEQNGYITFGKSGYNEMKWYIVGKDEAILGDNVVLFAKEPITTVTFEDEHYYAMTSKIYSSSWRCGYDTKPQKVDFNHYGASKVRATLQSITTDTNYFTLAEQSLMNETTITTTDVANDRMPYTTMDKLYLPTAQVLGSENTDADGSASENEVRMIYAEDAICLGTNDNLTIKKENWGSGRFFWLRTPSDTEGNEALYALPNARIDSDSVFDRSGVQPAVNLNLNSILFASSAEAATNDTKTGTIESKDGMKLRADGKGEMDGVCAKYNKKIITYTAKMGDAVMVQGNDGTDDWYYSFYVTEDTTDGIITLDEIKTALNNDKIQLATSQVWVERTVTDAAATDYGMLYAVQALAVPMIENVEVEIEEPESAEAFSQDAKCQTEGIAGVSVTWLTTDGHEVIETKAKYNTRYMAKIILTVEDGYEFAKEGQIYFNGNIVESENITINDEETVTALYTLDATAKAKITNVDVEGMEAEIGNAFTNFHTAEDVLDKDTTELPKNVEVSVEDDSATSMELTWSLKESYDTVPGNENIFVWQIAESEYADKYDTNSQPIEGEVAICNAAAIPVQLLGINGNVAYGEQSTIDVSQYFEIDANAGEKTYTLLTEEGTGEGTLDGTTLTVNKTGTYVVKLTTEAYGNYAAGEATATITVKGGQIVTGTVTGFRGEYDRKPHSIEVLVEKPEGVKITYSEDGVNYQEEKPSYVNAGTYTVYYKMEKENYETLTGSQTVEIVGKTLNIETYDQTFMWGQPLDHTKYAVVGGLLAGDTLVDITLSQSDDKVTEDGTIGVDSVTIFDSTQKDVSANYNVVCDCGNLTILHDPSLPMEEITATKDTDEYVVGDIIDTEDICVEGSYEDGYTEEIYNFTTDAASLDMTVGGDKVITVYYQANGEVLTAEIDIYVYQYRLDHIVAPQPVTGIANGTMLDTQAMGLPLMAQIVAVGGAVMEAEVEWYLEEFEEGSYNPNLLTQQTFVLLGEVILPDEVYDNEVDLDIYLTVTVNAAETAAPPINAPETVTPPINETPVNTYAVIVTSGETAKESYQVGERVVIKAKEAPKGQKFVKWQVVKGNITLADDTSRETSFIMPESAVQITAVYEKIPKETIIQPLTKEMKDKNERKLNKKLSVSCKGKTVTVKWGAVTGAVGYDVFLANCGKSFGKAAVSVQKKTKAKVSIKKIDQAKPYKIKVYAYRLNDGKKEYIANSKGIHIAGSNNSKYTNAKNIKTAKSTYRLQEGSTLKIKASIVKEDTKKKLFPESHAASLTYTSSNEEVAVVSKSGKIKAIKKGTCHITIRAANGVSKEIKVKVSKKTKS